MTAFDVLVGLLVGNVLAVLSWALMCAPIAVRERLTVYWQIRKIAGPYLTIVYSGAFALVLCLLAGAMVSVSTTAITHPLAIESANFAAGEYWPSLPWMFVAVLVGSVIAVLAVLGFERMAHFAKICAPWMPFVFLLPAVWRTCLAGCEAASEISGNRQRQDLDRRRGWPDTCNTDSGTASASPGSATSRSTWAWAT